ncbi:triphosphoribosyl-dephospho-CoA synthase CitG [Celerinatantimonas yamalensis]|uniref:Probable 2-(5''-triphosphoribosyl)-3'-dephosphocoenzyme-A synthase n=1 Tax=Celerinatantimonas yamalensis TaxID=559956 RepID=A0ABW9GAD4_9GAMM
MAGLHPIEVFPERPWSPLQSSQLNQDDVTKIIHQALWLEVSLTPKPGLVDCLSNGAHRDMDIAVFLASIEAIVPWFGLFFQCGQHSILASNERVLAELRPIGKACEQAMFQATRGINCHKGGIFALGLLCCALGRLGARQIEITQQSICRQVSAFCHGLVQRELQANPSPQTVGEHLYQCYGLSGARGEAERGFDTVRRFALPVWQTGIKQHRPLKEVMLHSLLSLMAYNQDTNLVSRGGMSGLRFVQHSAQRLLRMSWTDQHLWELDRRMIERNLSPGGSADLLAICYVLSLFPSGCDVEIKSVD